MMKIKKLKGNEGVSELIGTILLLVIAIIIFSSLITYVLSSTEKSPSPPNVNMVGYMDEYYHSVVEHRGGDTTELKDMKLIIWKGEEESCTVYFTQSGTPVNENGQPYTQITFHDLNSNAEWDVGDYIDIDCEGLFGDITHWQISMVIIDKPSNSIIMSGILQQGILHTSPPIAIFTYAPWDPKTQEIIEFNASQSYDPDGGSIVTYKWDFESDGTIDAYGMLVVHKYPSSGTYNVTLTVVDDEGQIGTATTGAGVPGVNIPPPINVTDNIPPVVNFTWEVDPDVDGTINFFSDATDPDGQVVSFFWNFGDGNTSSSQNPSHTYSHGGQYTVTLIVTDDNGGQTSFETTITVPNILPIAGFSYSPGNVTTARTVNFDGGSPYSYDKDGSIVNWTWDFDGNGVVDAYGATASYLFSTPGNYTVILNVTDNDGGWDVYQKNITVYSPATASPPRFLIVDNTPTDSPPGLWESGIDNIIAACQSIMPDSEFSYGKAIDQWTFTDDQYTSPDLRGLNITDTLINQFDIVIWSTGDFPGDGGNANWDGNANTWSTPMTEGYDDTSNHVHELAEHLTGNVTAGTLLLCGTYAARDLQDYPGNGANDDEIWLGNVLGLQEPTGGIHYDSDWVSFSGRLGSDWFRGEPYHVSGTLVGFANTSSGQINVATLNITSPIDIYALNKQSDSTFVYSLQASTQTTQVTLLDEDMETDPGWTTGGSEDEWDWGICKGGPGVAHSGSRCYGTDMSGSYYTYNNHANCYVRTGYIDLTSATSATLEFYDWYELENNYDYVRLQVYDGSWHTIQSFTGSQNSWTHKTFDLSPYVGNNIRIRWLLQSDGAVRYDGYYLDDVTLTATQQGIPNGYYAIDAERGRNRSIILGFDLNADEITQESRTNYLRNVLAWLAEGAGYATEVWVDNDPPEGWLEEANHVDTIQAGINAVPPGGRVYVIGTSGQVYDENVVVNKAIDLIGIDNPTIRASGTSVVDIESDWARIDGFNIEGNSAENGIYMENSARCTIINCTISNVTRMGIYLSSSHNNTIQANTIQNANSYGIYASLSLGNRIINNDISNSNTGIYLYKSSLSTITGNTIYNNDDGGGIYLEDLEQTMIYNNSILNNLGDGVHLIASTNRNTIENNTIQNNSNGIHLEISNSNIILSNNLLNNVNSGIYIEDYSHSNTMRGNNLLYNTMGINLQNSSNNGILYNSIQNNQYGVYSLSSSNNIFQINTICNNTHEGISLLSSSDNNMIYSSTIQNNSYGIYVHLSRNNTIEKNDISANNDDGIYFYYSMSGFSGGNRIINNTIYSNNGSGVSLYSSNGNIINDNKIYLNTENGISLSYSSDENVVTNNTIYNTYYGIYLSRAHYSTIMYNNIYHVSEHGIALFSYSSENDLINNTVNDSKNGIHLEYCNINNIVNNTLFENNENGIYITSSDLNTINNNIVYSNDDNGIALISSDENSLVENLIYSNTNGIYLLLAGGAGNTVSSNEIYGNTNHGVFLNSSRTATAGNNEIVENEIYSNGGDGICLLSSNINSVQGNTIRLNTLDGIYLNSSDSNTIQGNIIFQNMQNGLLLYLSGSNDVQSNNISFNGQNGICILQSSQGDSFPLQGNFIWNNTESGILINSANNNYITHNIIWNNSYGIAVANSSTNNEVYENNISTNGYGVLVSTTDCTSNKFYSNNFLNNDLHNNSQAYDAGSNSWYVSTTGNYWSDHISTDPYTIPPASNQDNYPQLSPIQW